MQMKERLFDCQLSALFSKQHKSSIDTQLIIAKTQKDYSTVKNQLYRCFAGHENREALEKEVDEFIETLEQEDSSKDFIDNRAYALVQEMKTFIQDSVKGDK